ncbi:hypothetical protein ACVWZX_005332, partial [Deinococcus sp. UYEF24]
DGLEIEAGVKFDSVEGATWKQKCSQSNREGHVSSEHHMQVSVHQKGARTTKRVQEPLTPCNISTHMTLHDHVERLLCLLTLTYVWCVLVGVTQECPLKWHGRRAWSVVTLGLRDLVRSISRAADHDAEGILALIKLLELPETT